LSINTVAAGGNASRMTIALFGAGFSAARRRR
jgi:MYXO-CTERM domain-containing protein